MIAAGRNPQCAAEYTQRRKTKDEAEGGDRLDVKKSPSRGRGRSLSMAALWALLLLFPFSAAGEQFVFRSGVCFEMSPPEVEAMESAAAHRQVPSVFTLSWGRLEYTGIEMYGEEEASLVYIFDRDTVSRLKEILVMLPVGVTALEGTFERVLEEMTLLYGPPQVTLTGQEGMPGCTSTLRAMYQPLFRKTGAAVMRLCQWLLQPGDGSVALDLYTCRDTYGVWQVRVGFALLSDPDAEVARTYIEDRKGNE